ncbi:MAG: hypothetical protein WA708_09825 [Acidobacteriaceae bacterium]
MATSISPIIAPQNPDTTGREIIVDGTVTLSGSYVVHGDTLNLQQFGDLLKSSQLPTEVDVWEDPAAGTSPTFAMFVFCPGTTQANGKLAIAIAGTELTAETYATAFPSGLPTLRIRAWFPAY